MKKLLFTALLMGVLCNVSNAQTVPIAETAGVGMPYKFKLLPGTTIAGSVLIGGSFAVYAISNTSYADRLAQPGNKYAAELTFLKDQYTTNKISADQYRTRSGEIDAKIEKEVNKIKVRQQTVNYICAGTSIVGVIVILAGLHKEYYGGGFQVAENLYCDPLNNGVAFTLRF